MIIGLALVACGADAVVRTSDGPHRHVATVASVPSDDMQPISYHGVAMRVPASWRINDTQCGTPMHDTVVVAQGATPACAVREPPGLTVVEILTTSTEPDSFGALYSTVATEAVTVDGSPARRGAGYITRLQARRSVLVLPDAGVVVSIESPDSERAGHLLDTVHLAPVDSNGCAASVPRLTPGPDPAPSASADALVPSDATSAAICRYRDLQLERSTTLSPADLVELRSITDALGVGVSRPGPGFAESPELCNDDRHRGFVIQAAAAHGPVAPVFVHIGGCDVLSASNGPHTTRIDSALVGFLTSAVGYDFSFPDPRELR